MRTGALIIIGAIAIAVFIYGKKLYNTIQTKIIEKEQFEKIENKLDSLFLDNEEIVRILSKQKDNVYRKIGSTARKMDTVYLEAKNYVVPDSDDEIIRELKKLTQ